MRRLVPIGAALLLAVAAQLSPTAAQTPPPVVQAQEGEASLDDLRAQLQSAQNRIAAIQQRATTVKDQIASIDRQFAKVEEALALSHKLVTETGARVAIIRQELEEKERRHDAVQSQAQAIAVALYKSGSIGELEILLAARDLGDFAETVQYSEAAADNRREVMDSLEQLESDLAVQAAAYQTELSAALVARSEKELLAQQLRELRAARIARLSDLKKEITEERQEAEALAIESDRIEQRLAGPSGFGGPVDLSDPSASGFIWPIRGAITSGFGMRWGRMHEGIDIDGETGDPIHASKAGTVSVFYDAGGYGNYVIVDHGAGYDTLYAHASEVYAADGQSVARGEVIAAVGSTGHSTGSHLHFEVRINGAAQNPLPFLP